MFQESKTPILDKNDQLEVYVVGYENAGESIIISIKNKFVGVIDCYKTDRFFQTVEILNSLEVTHFDFICWSHTDEDHTKGLSELLGNVKSSTHFIQPSGITFKEIKGETKTAKEHKSECEHIFTFLEENKVKCQQVHANEFTSLSYSFNVSGSSEPLTITIESFAPIGEISKRFSKRSIMDILSRKEKTRDKPNYHSVGLKIIVKHTAIPITICLTSDLDNYTIRRMHPMALKKNFTDNVIFKIPHHGSLNSNLLLENNLIHTFEHAVSTSYKISNLPNRKLLSDYKNIYQNGTLSTTCEKNNQEEFGIVKYNMPLINFDRNSITVDYFGDAGEFNY
ncbi:hypothetical protein HF072_03925 [Bacillus sp. RO3]|nr:hypothetical protein [Bacillus sp. RO3]